MNNKDTIHQELSKWKSVYDLYKKDNTIKITNRQDWIQLNDIHFLLFNTRESMSCDNCLAKLFDRVMDWYSKYTPTPPQTEQQKEPEPVKHTFPKHKKKK